MFINYHEKDNLSTFIFYDYCLMKSMIYNDILNVPKCKSPKSLRFLSFKVYVDIV